MRKSTPALEIHPPCLFHLLRWSALSTTIPRSCVSVMWPCGLCREIGLGVPELPALWSQVYSNVRYMIQLCFKSHQIYILVSTSIMS